MDFFLLAIVAIALIIVLVFINYKMNQLQKGNNNETINQWLSSIQQAMQQSDNNIANNLQQSQNNLTQTLQQSNNQVNKRFDTAFNLFQDIGKELGKMNQMAKTMYDLQLLLKSPKLRGNLGEQILTQMLEEVLPRNAFTLQYTFKSGAKVDAVIKTSAGLLCIDAKFPLENFYASQTMDDENKKNLAVKQFSKDVRKHIKDIASKYLLTEENTLNFALLYVPSESVFLEMINDIEILEAARANRIYPVSPNTLYVHLQTILLALEGQKLEKKSQEIFKLFQALHQDYGKVDETIQTLGKHLNNAHHQFHNVTQQLQIMGNKFDKKELIHGE